MKNSVVKSEIKLEQKLTTQMIIMKNIWKTNLIPMMIYL